MGAADHDLKIEEGANFGEEYRVIKSDRTLADLTGYTPRCMARLDPDDADPVWDYVEDGKHLINGLTDGTIQMKMDATETDDLSDEDGLTGASYDLELVECDETQIVESGAGGQSIAFANSTVYGHVTASVALGAAPTVGDVHRIKLAEDAANDGSYEVVGTDGGAPANPTTTVWYYTRTLTANAADTTCDIYRLDEDETKVVRLLNGRVEFSEENTH